MTPAGKRCVFFDRDGIANRDPAPKRYVETLAEFHIVPEFVEALQVVRSAGYAAVVVTNQKGVGSGVVDPRELDRIHAALRARAEAAGAPLLDIFACTATDDAHPNRKPNPGMLLDAATRHGLDLSRSWMVGDSERDVVAGKRAGCRTVLVKAGDKPSEADFRLTDIGQLPGFLRSHL